MLSISTAFISRDCQSGRNMLKSIESLDVDAIELEYRVTAPLFREIQECLPGSHLKISSIHNYFPFSFDPRRMRPSGDLFLLSHTDKEARETAIKETIKSLEIADDMEVPALVLHCGKVDLDFPKAQLYGFYERGEMQSEAAQKFLQKCLAECKAKTPPHLDALLMSLDKLIRPAEKYGIKLGLENRLYYHQIPGIEEFEMIFQEFEGGPLGYWHDTGHAHVQEELTLMPRHALLEKFAHQLMGVHLHDTKGLRDHLPPGDGDTDFKTIHEFLKEDTILVMELRPGTSLEDAARGIRFLREFNFTY